MKCVHQVKNTVFRANVIRPMVIRFNGRGPDREKDEKESKKNHFQFNSEF
jgi:hypothetical protein